MLRIFCWVTAFTALLIISNDQAYAQGYYTYFPSDGAFTPGVAVNNAVVGYANDNDYRSSPRKNPTSPTVSLTAGFYVNNILWAYNSSTLNMSGGHIVNGLFAYDASAVNISGGTIGSNNMYNGPRNTYINAYNSSSVDISGGTLYTTLNAFANASRNISGGDIKGAVFASENSTADMSGGHVHALVAYDSGVINVRGGFSDEFAVNDSGTLNFFGSGLSTSLYDANRGDYSLYVLSGTLQDGSTLFKSLYVKNGTSASFHLFNSAAVPEPSALVLLIGMAAAGAGFFRRRRK